MKALNILFESNAGSIFITFNIDTLGESEVKISSNGPKGRVHNLSSEWCLEAHKHNNTLFIKAAK